MTDVLVLTAVELEARRLARELELPRLGGAAFPIFERRRAGYRLRLAPVGLRAAGLEARWPDLLGDLSHPLVISAGTCGALAPELGVGDLVLPESVLGLAAERLNVTPGAHGVALRCAPDARTGLLLTTADVVATPEAKARCFRETGALTVDLESARILVRASRAGCPSLVVRAVSDTARQCLPAELVGLVTPEGKIPLARVLALAVTRPATMAQALLLRHGVGRALKAVARVIAALVE